ncbi:ATP-binding response regulator [Azospirillum sp. sgz301742]
MKVAFANTALTATIFCLDAALPDGVSINILYVIPLYLSSYSNYPHATFLWALLLSIASAAVSLIAPQGLPMEWELLDRTLTIIVLWLSAVIIHQLKHQRERALQEQAAAVDATKAKTHFLAAASHDLSQPVQSLFFFAEALRDHVQGDGGKKLLERLEHGLDVLKELLDDLLEISRIDAGGITPHVEDFAIKPMLDEIATSCGPITAAKGLDLTIAGAAGIAVRSDPHLLRRIIRNLVENAIKYTEKGGIRIECTTAGERLRLEVHDTGIGIAPSQQERIFDEFHQVGNPERDRNLGLGLGLSIVRRLSALLDHPMTVTSELGKGSVFVVDLPLSTVKIELPAHASAPTASNGLDRLAVLVDDDAIVLMGLQATLQEWGYDTLVGASTEQVVERLKANERAPDIIIADYRLRQGRTGMEAIREIRKLVGAEIPAIILTGEVETEWRRDASDLSVGVAAKPITPRQLRQILEQHLGAKV